MSAGRSVERDVKTMAMGLDAINASIALIEGNTKIQKALKNRLSRLRVAKAALINDPKNSADLIKRYKGNK